MSDPVVPEGSASAEIQALVLQINEALRAILARIKRIEDRLTQAGF